MPSPLDDARRFETYVPPLSTRLRAHFAALKAMVSIIAVIIGGFYLLGGYDASDGIKAALFALLSAGVLTMQIVSSGYRLRLRIIDACSRLVGVSLGVLAGWHWLMSETNGAIWPFLQPLALIGVPVVIALTLNLLETVFYPRRVKRHVGFASAIDAELTEEYERLWTYLESYKDKPHQPWTFMLTSEHTTAYLLHFLESSHRIDFSQRHLDALLALADIPESDTEAGTLLRGHYRRLRLMVRGYAGETTPAP